MRCRSSTQRSCAWRAPYRTYNDPRTDIGTHVTAPFGEFIKTVTLIIDENPMPVSAVFELAEPRRAFAFSGSMRINGPTMVRIVAETDRGNFYMQETFVKTSGTGACSAPPGTDPLIALETLGTMKFKLLEGDGESVLASLDKTTPLQSGGERPVGWCNSTWTTPATPGCRWTRSRCCSFRRAMSTRSK